MSKRTASQGAQGVNITDDNAAGPVAVTAAWRERSRGGEQCVERGEATGLGIDQAGLAYREAGRPREEGGDEGLFDRLENP